MKHALLLPVHNISILRLYTKQACLYYITIQKVLDSYCIQNFLSISFGVTALIIIVIIKPVVCFHTQTV